MTTNSRDEDDAQEKDKGEKGFKNFAKELGGATTFAFFIALAGAVAQALVESMRDKGR
nr:hypothetical protein [Herbaspirillum sp. ASV7]